MAFWFCLITLILIAMIKCVCFVTLFTIIKQFKFLENNKTLENVLEFTKN